jgi:uncharacterized protein (DUF302 family)
MSTTTTDRVAKGPVAFEARTRLDFAAAVARSRAALATEGFGVLCEIDIQAKLREKLGHEREPYLILGACHPPSAKRALEAAPEVGVLLPCNVTISREGGATVVRAMNPEGALALIDAPDLHDVACEVGAALRRVVDTVAAS